MSQRELRSRVKKNVESFERMANTESSSIANNVKKSVRYAENAKMRMRQENLMKNESDKENRAGKESETLAHSVRQIKGGYEENLIRRKNVIVPDGKNTTATGAIKKRKKSDIESAGDERKNVPNKRLNIREDDFFQKSRFKVYKDDSKTSRSKDHSIGRLGEGKSENNVENKLRAIVAENKRLDEIVSSEVHGRRGATPIEIVPLETRPKKVKVLHRKSSSKNCEASRDTQGSASLYSQYDLPYDDNLIEYELAKEKSISNISRRLGQQNITDKQRKIIVKFLTRLNSHLFYPSYLLYQTVKLFDAILDTTVIEIEDLQLNALAAMWIVLKREYTVYKIPTAETIVSFSKDLYEGKTDLLLKCEMKILQTLNFNIVFSDPFSILFYNIIKWKNSPKMTTNEIATAYYCGNYMIDLSLFDQELIKISAVLLAVAAAEIALYFTMVGAKADQSSPLWFDWRAPHTVQRYSEQDIEPVRSTLIEKISESSVRHSEADIVFKKYTRSRYGRISHFLGSKVRSYLYPE